MTISKKIFIATLIFTNSFFVIQGKLPESWQEAKEACKKTAHSVKHTWDNTLKNISFGQSHAEKYPGRTAFAQFCYAHPILSSLGINGLGFLTLKRYTRRVLRNSKGNFGVLPYVSTGIGALGISEWAHNYLRLTKTPHYMSPFITRCTKECKNTNKELHDAVFNR